MAVMIPPLSFAQDDMRLLRKSILEDRTMDQVYDMAHDVVSAGLNAGSGYGEVWIRDFNTFITTAMDVMPDEIIRSSLNTFFKFQGPSGDIVDGYLPVREADLDSKDGYAYRLSPLAPQYAAHKNTVETDQETSLIQAVFQYVSKSGNRDYLKLLVSDTTAKDRWSSEKGRIIENVRRYLWDGKAGKFIPHLYLEGSPFPASFDENVIYYHGGTAVSTALLLRLLTECLRMGSSLT